MQERNVEDIVAAEPGSKSRVREQEEIRKDRSAREDSVAGVLLSPIMAGSEMCAVMIASSPDAIAARKGTNSTVSRRARDTVIVGSVRCEF